jgi:drug/metabolite transporter (DMT)-like permease
MPAKTAARERWTGTIFIFLSTFFYAISNVVIRYLTNYEVDNDWILFYKETIGLSFLIPWLLFRWGQGRFQYTSNRLVLYVILAAVWCQLIGARLHVLGFAVIGLIITVPLVQSSTLLGVAIIGYFVFGDSLSQRRKFAIAILIVALTVLSIGKALIGAGQPLGENNVSAGYFLLVAAGTIAAGIAYAIYITMLRYVIRQHWKDENSARLSFKFRRWVGHDHVQQPGQRFYSPFPVTLTMSIVLAVGAVIFGTCLYCKHGITGFYNVPDVAWHRIVISGAANMTGFFFQIQGLRMTSAVQASLIAVCQMLLLSLIGYLFFDEAVNATLTLPSAIN